MARYLLDTNVLAEALRPKPDPRILARLDREFDECVTAAPVVHEMRYGCELLDASRRRAALERYLDDVVLRHFAVLPYDAMAADWHARERARLARSGTPLPSADGVIAAIAATSGLILVTANLRDFQRYRGLQVEDWGG